MFVRFSFAGAIHYRDSKVAIVAEDNDSIVIMGCVSHDLVDLVVDSLFWLVAVDRSNVTAQMGDGTC